MSACAQEEGRAEEGLHRRLSLHRRRSIPLLLNYSPLDFMEALSEGKAFNGDAIYLSSAQPANHKWEAHMHWLSG